MDLSKQRKVDLEKAVSFLPDDEWIHIFIKEGEEQEEAKWSRKLVIDRMEKHGVELSGELMMSHQHGLSIFDGKKHIFIQTRLQPKGLVVGT